MDFGPFDILTGFEGYLGEKGGFWIPNPFYGADEEQVKRHYEKVVELYPVLFRYYLGILFLSGGKEALERIPEEWGEWV